MEVVALALAALAALASVAVAVAVVEAVMAVASPRPQRRQRAGRRSFSVPGMCCDEGRTNGRNHISRCHCCIALTTRPSARLLSRVPLSDKIPQCKHGEPTKRQTVRKAGPNQGRHFYSCQRPEGPRSNREANCGFFQWANDVGGKRKDREEPR